MLIKAPKGTSDVLPSEIYKWQYIEKMMIDLCRNYGYKEIRIPVFEHTELFRRGVGDTTDIVQKEMYTFNDKGGRSITLRPEGTAGVVRSYIEYGMSSLPQPIKLYYFITAYRYENVQKGRSREFHQFGIEAFGVPGPSIDVEIISMTDILFKRLGLKGVKLNINSVGCPVCRGEYNKKLKQYFEPVLDNLCSTCKTRYDRNPLRILDCKDEKCKKYTCSAPTSIDNLCKDCNDHFEGLKSGLENLGIRYEIDTGIVRGLDYYTKTVFEFVSENVGTQGTICGGGRYDGLMEECGGTPTPGIGFGLGFERLLLEMESQGIAFPKPPGIDIFIAIIGEKPKKYAEKLGYELRGDGINAEIDHMGRSLKAQMKYADKLGAVYTAVLGDNEIDGNKIVIKDMRSGEQTVIGLGLLSETLRIKKAGG